MIDSGGIFVAEFLLWIIASIALFLPLWRYREARESVFLAKPFADIAKSLVVVMALIVITILLAFFQIHLAAALLFVITTTAVAIDWVLIVKEMLE